MSVETEMHGENEAIDLIHFANTIADATVVSPLLLRIYRNVCIFLPNLVRFVAVKHKKMVYPFDAHCKTNLVQDFSQTKTNRMHF